MLRVAEDVEHRAVLDFFAAEHHEHVVGDLGDHAQVVRDEDDRHAALVAELAEDVENLGLDRDVERGASARRRSAACGLQERAIAIITRCFCPPDIWCG